MSDEEAPPPDDHPSDPPGSVFPKEGRRSRLEGVIPEILKRAVEIGVEKARESPDNVRQFVADLKLPKEVAHVIFQQIDDTKNGLFRVVAKEIRDFLEHTNFAGEVQKLLTTVQFEVNTTIRFTPNDGRDPPRKDGDEGDEGPRSTSGSSSAPPGSSDKDGPASGSGKLPKPEVKTSVSVRRDDRDPARRGARGRRTSM
ncbi:MAG: putative protease [Labilithrix sp.]|nr:putative protease [Labilithrix sp.]